MSRTTLLLIRHAESTWNAVGRWQGAADPPLSERGRRQAEALARELADSQMDRIVCSDLARALETAAMLGAKRGLTPQPTAALRELDVGSWTGLTRSEIESKAADTLARFESGDAQVRAGGAENRLEIRLRVRRAVRDLVAANAGRQIVVVTHLGVIRALLPGSNPAHAECHRVREEDLERVI